jgi:dCMP deaminase
MKPKFIEYYMKLAELTADLSSAVRLKVGSVIVRDNQILATGYNGTPSGWDNNCEYKEYLYHGHNFGEFAADYFDQTDEDGKMYRLRTRPEVIHSESNAILKVARSTESSVDATMFCTHAPCIDCAKLIYQSGINTLYYRNTYRSESGVDFLLKSGVNVQRYNPD